MGEHLMKGDLTLDNVVDVEDQAIYNLAIKKPKNNTAFITLNSSQISAANIKNSGVSEKGYNHLKQQLSGAYNWECEG